ncbi:MAG TPA: hypothetical protein PKE55_05540 [Kiritimatiellia bacterium]|nr:hypothetical protein [Kiritimatiellia bacterium]
MVTTTTFGPSPVRQVPKKKKPKLPLVPLLLGLVAIIALIAAVVFAAQASGERQRTADLAAGLGDLASVANLEGITAESFLDPSNADAALTSIKESISGLQLQAQIANAELETVRTDLGRIRTDRDQASQQASSLQSTVDGLRREIADKDATIASLNQTLADTRSSLEADIARLRAERNALATQAAETSAQAMDDEEATSMATDNESYLVLEDDSEFVEEEGSLAEPVFGDTIQLSERSRLFESKTYDPETRVLQFVTLNGKTLTYRDVPQEIVDRLNDAIVYDNVFRQRVYQEFPSEPYDRQVIRSLRAR